MPCDTALVSHRYLFVSTWDLPVAPEAVYATLRDIASYPRWWREIRRASRIDGESCALVCRSLLPYDLAFSVHQARVDERALVLEAQLHGDLEGVSRWTLAGASGRCRARFEEDVVVHKALLRALEPIARPALRANHSLMMRSGERGLRDYLRATKRIT